MIILIPGAFSDTNRRWCPGQLGVRKPLYGCLRAMFSGAGAHLLDFSYEKAPEDPITSLRQKERAFALGWSE